MHRDSEQRIEDVFAECLTPIEVAVLYAELFHKTKIQLDFMMDSFDDDIHGTE